MRNGSGYVDPTAYKALTAVAKYGSDCVVFALQQHLAERKIHIEIDGRRKKK